MQRYVDHPWAREARFMLESVQHLIREQLFASAALLCEPLLCRASQMVVIDREFSQLRWQVLSCYADALKGKGENKRALAMYERRHLLTHLLDSLTHRIVLRAQSIYKRAISERKVNKLRVAEQQSYKYGGSNTPQQQEPQAMDTWEPTLDTWEPTEQQRAQEQAQEQELAQQQQQQFTAGTPEGAGVQGRSTWQADYKEEAQLKFKEAKCLMENKQDAAAISALEAIVLFARTVEMNLVLARCYETTGMNKNAINVYKHALRQCPLALEAALALLRLDVSEPAIWATVDPLPSAVAPVAAENAPTTNMHATPAKSVRFATPVTGGGGGGGAPGPSAPSAAPGAALYVLQRRTAHRQHLRAASAAVMGPKGDNCAKNRRCGSASGCTRMRVWRAGTTRQRSNRDVYPYLPPATAIPRLITAGCHVQVPLRKRLPWLSHAAALKSYHTPIPAHSHTAPPPAIVAPVLKHRARRCDAQVPLRKRLLWLSNWLHSYRTLYYQHTPLAKADVLKHCAPPPHAGAAAQAAAVAQPLAARARVPLRKRLPWFSHWLHAHACALRGQYAAALDSWGFMITVLGGEMSTGALIGMGQAHLELGNLEKADLLLAKAHNRDPLNMDGMDTYAKVLCLSGNVPPAQPLDAAVAALKAPFVRSAVVIGVWLQKGFKVGQGGDVPSAQPLDAAVAALQAPFVRSAVVIGVGLQKGFEVGQGGDVPSVQPLDAAVAALKAPFVRRLNSLVYTLIDVDPNRGEAWVAAALYADIKGDVEKAYSGGGFKKTQERDSGNRVPWAWVNAALYADIKGDVEKEMVSYGGMVRCYLKSKKHVEAVSTAKQAMKRFPTRADPLVLMGKVLAETGKVKGETGRAAQAYKAALALEPGHVGASMALADCLTVAGEHEECIALLSKAFETNSRTPDALPTKLGDACVAARRYDDALRYYHIATRQNSANDAAKEGLRRLDMILRGLDPDFDDEDATIDGDGDNDDQLELDDSEAMHQLDCRCSLLLTKWQGRGDDSDEY
ncbi:hypothetical protein JKP88DRAFT_262625 [Tribonema minus]|uniref:Uncharacterized protein n=1 Tax=Tribonema minus TaxID=303371 RepID=A0A835Z3A2_9STRA|nr:hypothetical protein JKP88DRAFT_262625 [Tribonema minus]